MIKCVEVIFITMPELPEVEIVKRGLEGAIAHQRIGKIVLSRPDLRFPIPEDFVSGLQGKVVTSLRRRGKYILVFVESGAGFVLHLGMSGVVKIIPPGDPYSPAKHDHIFWDFEDGTQIVFHDPRRFGFIDMIRQARWDGYPAFKAMGPEPLSNDFNGDVLYGALAKRKGAIKTVLLDQKTVAGLGNIYVCEALFLAGIHPERTANTVKAREAEVLARCIRDVLIKAIDSGGSSLKDYYHTDGSLGYFQHYFAVYDREGAACPKCGAGDCIKRIVQAGRSTFFCPVQQR